jgi:diacylglycerol kinase (ATP)
MSPDHSNPQKSRTGLHRIFHAARYSFQGLGAAWHETAFRQEAIAAFCLIPLAFWLGQTWLEVVILIGSWVAVLIVELLNTGIETSIDRIGPQWHELSKRAKDIGSAAVLLSLLFAIGVWGSLIYLRVAS